MRRWPITALLLCITGAALAESLPALDSFKTAAGFSVDEDHLTLTLTTAIATVEPYGKGGYSWIRIHFYSFPPAKDDLPLIAKGDVSSMDRKWEALAEKDIDAYDSGNAVLQMSLDKNSKVWRADLRLPGHICMIAYSAKEMADFLKQYSLSGDILTLKTKGSHTCNMSFTGGPDETYTWDVNLKARLYKAK